LKSLAIYFYDFSQPRICFGKISLLATNIFNGQPIIIESGSFRPADTTYLKSEFGKQDKANSIKDTTFILNNYI